MEVERKSPSPRVLESEDTHALHRPPCMSEDTPAGIIALS
jgi:hypothetical protein